MGDGVKAFPPWNNAMNAERCVFSCCSSNSLVSTRFPQIWQQLSQKLTRSTLKWIIAALKASHWWNRCPRDPITWLLSNRSSTLVDCVSPCGQWQSWGMLSTLSSFDGPWTNSTLSVWSGESPEWDLKFAFCWNVFFFFLKCRALQDVVKERDGYGCFHAGGRSCHRLHSEMAQVDAPLRPPCTRLPWN